jgi:hypothetical protein
VTVAMCPPPRRRSVRGVARGVWFVLVLLGTAVDALLTALIGVPPLTWLARRIDQTLTDEYRRGYHNAVDAEVVEDADDPVE